MSSEIGSPRRQSGQRPGSDQSAGQHRILCRQDPDRAQLPVQTRFGDAYQQIGIAVAERAVSVPRFKQNIQGLPDTGRTKEPPGLVGDRLDLVRPAAFDRLGQLPGQPVRRSPGPAGIGKDVKLGEGAGPQEGERLGMILLGFARKARDKIPCQGAAGEIPPDCRDR